MYIYIYIYIYIYVGGTGETEESRRINNYYLFGQETINGWACPSGLKWTTCLIMSNSILQAAHKGHWFTFFQVHYCIILNNAHKLLTQFKNILSC